MDETRSIIPPEFLQRALEGTEHGLYVTDADGVILWANAGMARLTGFTTRELVGARCSIFSSHTMSTDYYNRLWNTIRHGMVWREEIVNRRKNGELYTAFQVINPVIDERSSVTHYIAVQHDVTRQKQIERALQDTLLEYDSIFRNTQDALFLVDVTSDGLFAFRKLNPTHERLTGLTTDAVRGKTPEQLLGSQVGGTVSANFKRCVDARSPITYEEELNLPQGVRVWSTKLQPVFEGDRVAQIVGSSRDITAQKELEQRLRHLSEVDELTRVANRRRLQSELELEIGRSRRHAQPLSVLMIDVDHFKRVNDELGHHVGDATLKGVTDALQRALRPTDRFGRWGGEEFLAILSQTDATGALSAAERLLNAVSSAAIVPGRTITVSIGVGELQENHQTADQLVRLADEALYTAKEGGRNQVRGPARPR